MKGRNGGTLRNGGKPGNKGGGTLTKTFRIRMQTLAERTKVAERLEKALDSGKGAEFWRALTYVTEHGHGRPPQAVDMTSGGEPIQTGVIVLPAADWGQEETPPVDPVVARNGAHP